MGEAKVLPCNVIEIAEGHAIVQVGGLRHSLPVKRPIEPGPARLAVRANAIKLTPAGGEPKLPGRIQSSAYLGDHVEYEVALESDTVFVVDTGTPSPLLRSTDVSVDFRDRGIALITE